MPQYNTNAWATQPLNLEPDKPRTMPAVTTTAEKPPAPTPAPAPAPSAFGPTESNALKQLAMNSSMGPPPPMPIVQQQDTGDDQLMYMIKQLLMRKSMSSGRV